MTKACYDVLDEIVSYHGGAANALEDEYVMARAQIALDGFRELHAQEAQYSIQAALADEIEKAIAVTIRKRNNADRVVNDAIMSQHRDLIVAALRAYAAPHAERPTSCPQVAQGEHWCVWPKCDCRSPAAPAERMCPSCHGVPEPANADWEHQCSTCDGSGRVSHSPAVKEAEEDWRDDPSADERWNAGLDYGMKAFCEALSVDPQSVRWDAATETLDGDVNAVIWNILRAKMGEDWDPDATRSSQPVSDSAVFTKRLNEANAEILRLADLDIMHEAAQKLLAAERDALLYQVEELKTCLHDFVFKEAVSDKTIERAKRLIAERAND